MPAVQSAGRQERTHQTGCLQRIAPCTIDLRSSAHSALQVTASCDFTKCRALHRLQAIGRRHSVRGIGGTPKEFPTSLDRDSEPTHKIAGSCNRRPGAPNSKARVEATLTRAASAGLRSASLRYFNAAGADIGGEIGEAHEPETHLLPLAIDATLGLGPSLTLLGDDYPTPDGSCVRDFIHVSDLADAHLRALHWLQRAPVTGLHEQFNVGSGSGYSVRQVMTETARITGSPSAAYCGAPPAWRLAPPGRQHRKVAPRARLASQA